MGSFTDIDVTATIEPLPCSRIAGSTARIILTALISVNSKTQLPRLVVKVVEFAERRTAGINHQAIDCAEICGGCGNPRTNLVAVGHIANMRGCKQVPRDRSCPAAALMSSGFRLAIETRAPSAAVASATPNPRPVLAPATMITLSFNLRSIASRWCCAKRDRIMPPGGPGGQ